MHISVARNVVGRKALCLKNCCRDLVQIEVNSKTELFIFVMAIWRQSLERLPYTWKKCFTVWIVMKELFYSFCFQHHYLQRCRVWFVCVEFQNANIAAKDSSRYFGHIRSFKFDNFDQKFPLIFSFSLLAMFRLLQSSRRNTLQMFSSNAKIDFLLIKSEWVSDVTRKRVK